MLSYAPLLPIMAPLPSLIMILQIAFIAPTPVQPRSKFVASVVMRRVGGLVSHETCQDPHPSRPVFIYQWGLKNQHV